MKVIIKEPNKESVVEEVENTLKALQAAVGGPIEIFKIAVDVGIICNEEGKIIGLPYNCTVIGEQFVGTILVVGIDEEEFTDVPEAVLKNDMRFWKGCMK